MASDHSNELYEKPKENSEESAPSAGPSNTFHSIAEDTGTQEHNYGDSGSNDMTSERSISPDPIFTEEAERIFRVSAEHIEGLMCQEAIAPDVDLARVLQWHESQYSTLKKKLDDLRGHLVEDIDKLCEGQITFAEQRSWPVTELSSENLNIVNSSSDLRETLKDLREMERNAFPRRFDFEITLREFHSSEVPTRRSYPDDDGTDNSGNDEQGGEPNQEDQQDLRPETELTNLDLNEKLPREQSKGQRRTQERANRTYSWTKGISPSEWDPNNPWGM